MRFLLCLIVVFGLLGCGLVVETALGHFAEQFVRGDAVLHAGFDDDVADVIRRESAQFGQPLLLREAVVR